MYFYYVDVLLVGNLLIYKVKIITSVDTKLTGSWHIINVNLENCHIQLWK